MRVHNYTNHLHLTVVRNVCFVRACARARACL